MRFRPLRAALALVVAVPVVTLTGNVPGAVAGVPAWCGSARTIAAASLPPTFSLAECDVVGRLVSDVHVGAVVPRPGEAVYVAASGTDHDELRIEVSPDGIVTLADVGHGEHGEQATSGALLAYDECNDQSKNEHSYSESDVHTWFYNRSTTPSYLSQTTTENAMIRGTNHINTLYTDCTMGLGNSPSSTSRQNKFAGNTTLRANISNDANCVDRDGINVVNWGDLPSGTLAVACTWYIPLFGEVTEGDIKFNGVDHSWINGLSGCIGQHDVEAVMVHERGHTYGLGHVSESASPTMTMSPQIGTCSTRERTLGYGDMLGLTYK